MQVHTGHTVAAISGRRLYRRELSPKKVLGSNMQALNIAVPRPRGGDLTANGMSRRISVHSLPEKGANTRNEQMLSSTTNEIVRGPNLIESVGDYDYDHADRMKKTIMQEEYKRQLEEAQKLTVPVSMSTARVALMPQIKQKAELTPDPFHHGGVYLGAHSESSKNLIDKNTTLPMEEGGGQRTYTGFKRSGVHLEGLHASEEAVRQERAGERAKAAEFYQAAEQANSQQPLRSPRGTTYRGHQFPLVEESTTPYMAAADQLLQNRALLEEKLGQDPELMREVEEQIRAAVDQGYDPDQAREIMMKRLAVAQYQAQLAADATKNAAVAHQAPDRVSLAAYKPGGSRGEEFRQETIMVRPSSS